ncbi:hypothetical protein [Janthinobacterium sp. PSPC3-1]|uniref:hypothetical protein n=1 Tax=Janthinobacterium sp. PSPC3-1 TaxID=2804653 RepID=UPI003CF23C24
MDYGMDGLAARVAACEQENRRLHKVIKRQNLLWAGALLVAAVGTATAGIALKNGVFGTIRANDITIVDKNGVVRARMSGDMPDAVMFGGRVAKRGGEAAGFMIYDKDGYERGGYVTFDHDNAMLSLDSKYHMVASLIAGPGESGTGVLALKSSDGGLELRSDLDGARLSVNQGRTVAQQIPAIEALSEASCRNWREIEKQHPNENACRSRYTESACKRCLDEQ